MANATTNKLEREARLRWIPLEKMKVSPLGQRDLNPARVDRLAATFDLEQLGTPTVNLRDGHYYIVDGQHRVEALREIGWGDQQIQCWTYEGLSEQEEAEKFLQINDVLVVQAFDRFTKGVTAGRDDETEVDRVVRAQGLCVSRDKTAGAIRAPGTLMRVYKRTDSATLGRAVRIIRDAYGDGGFVVPVIDGVGYLCARYNGDLDDKAAVAKLGNVHGGVNGLLGEAEKIRRQTGNAKGLCVAAAAVEIINRGRGGKKLPSWWKS